MPNIKDLAIIVLCVEKALLWSPISQHLVERIVKQAVLPWHTNYCFYTGIYIFMVKRIKGNKRKS